MGLARNRSGAEAFTVLTARPLAQLLDSPVILLLASQCRDGFLPRTARL